MALATLEQQHGQLSDVEVDVVTSLVGHGAAEVPTDETVPSRSEPLVELSLDVRSDVLVVRAHV